MTRPIEIFRPGRHLPLSGRRLDFSATDLAATAAAYDPARFEAPLVVGHPAMDAPAYGWVERLSFADGRLVAMPRQVEPQFQRLVNEGRYKRVSASFFTPNSPDNPAPGTYYTGPKLTCPGTWPCQPRAPWRTKAGRACAQSRL
jgi:hypothetical protein